MLCSIQFEWLLIVFSGTQRSVPSVGNIGSILSHTYQIVCILRYFYPRVHFKVQIDLFVHRFLCCTCFVNDFFIKSKSWSLWGTQTRLTGPSINAHVQPFGSVSETTQHTKPCELIWKKSAQAFVRNIKKLSSLTPYSFFLFRQS